ncbi:hypothetical protein GDO81_029798 [Engystomops pustulosus]|uniref:Uncharacterized protein n=1 Tax=Engystomops pustulosus TaxID=76066 RepID=A0AAV6YMC8_ENGPU|nr:hypothetical protein GDO81_029798 [Engystomops pustulosus]
MKGTDKSTGMETIPEEHGEVGSGEEPKYDHPPDREDEQDREETPTSRKENSSAKRLLNRQNLVPARVIGISLSQDLERIPKPKTGPER